MPSYKGHVTGGLVTFFLAYAVATHLFSHAPYDLKKFLFTGTFCLLGSLFPDIDTKSVGQRVFYSLLTIAVTFSILNKQWELLSALSLISIFPILVNHRGIIHTIWFVTLVPLGLVALVWHTNPHILKLAWQAYYYFVTGALSHLLLDRKFS